MAWTRIGAWVESHQAERKLIGALLLVSPTVLLAQVVPKPAPKPSSPLQESLGACLPSTIKLSDVAEVLRSSPTARAITVADKLQEVKATCDAQERLIDAEGREIVFYPLRGCWGHPPPDYREIMQKQRAELERLKQTKTVIEMTCNPSGVRIP